MEGPARASPTASCASADLTPGAGLRTGLLSDRERAALAWTEAVTLVASTRVPDSVYDEVRTYFNDKELSDLTLAIAATNAWNRLSVASRREASLDPDADATEQRRAS